MNHFDCVVIVSMSVSVNPKEKVDGSQLMGLLCPLIATQLGPILLMLLTFLMSVFVFLPTITE